MLIQTLTPDTSSYWFYTSKELVTLWNQFSWLKDDSLAVLNAKNWFKIKHWLQTGHWTDLIENWQLQVIATE